MVVILGSVSVFLSVGLSLLVNPPAFLPLLPCFISVTDACFSFHVGLLAGLRGFAGHGSVHDHVVARGFYIILIFLFVNRVF